MKTVDLGKLFENLQVQLRSQLRLVNEAADHPGAKGSATESGWIELLAKHLPARYRVSQGFVIDSEGSVSDEIDVVIHDNQYSPFLLREGAQTFVPAESVYAVFEVKPRLDRRYLRYAGAKAASVRRLHRTSVEIHHAGGVLPPKPPGEILAGILCAEASWSPPFGQPFVSTLEGLEENHRLDLGCCLDAGAFYVHRPAGGTASRVETSRPETALAFFLLCLLQAFQRLATVPAMDLEAYRRVLR